MKEDNIPSPRDTTPPHLSTHKNTPHRDPLHKDIPSHKDVLYLNTFFVSFHEPESTEIQFSLKEIIVCKHEMLVIQNDTLTIDSRWKLVDLDQIGKTINGFICFAFKTDSSQQVASHKYLQVKEKDVDREDIPVLMEFVAQALSSVQETFNVKKSKSKVDITSDDETKETDPEKEKFSQSRNSHSKQRHSRKIRGEEVKKEKRNKQILDQNQESNVIQVPLHDTIIPTKEENLDLKIEHFRSCSVDIGNDGRKIRKRRDKEKKSHGIYAPTSYRG